ncbi:hypothetical protein [Halobacillus sp. BBL2006]|uniref:hypothetical protein n=1 Tax=Halobacillus sp. BBL2006 TaxID=1543706 RepID=UPI000543011E|nr:hypothetical protein [Halobacillus sp. BBL2006]KHE73166.1 hypothetical protein LD39_00845 [Halobacillus sp. BBL2006]
MSQDMESLFYQRTRLQEENKRLTEENARLKQQVRDYEEEAYIPLAGKRIAKLKHLLEPPEYDEMGRRFELEEK